MFEIGVCLALTAHHVHDGEWLPRSLCMKAGQDPGCGHRKGPGMRGHTQSWRDGLEQGSEDLRPVMAPQLTGVES